MPEPNSESASELGSEPSPVSPAAVLVTVFAIGTCGLIYELLAGTLASYVLGDSVTQFSTIIGVYLFAMGIGAWLSKFIDKNIIARFVEIEIVIALVGGASAAILFLSFARLAYFRVLLYGIVLLIGILVGLEIPLLTRILKDRYELKDLIARVLTVDYLGALLASLAFPLFLVPKLGLIRGSFAVGLINGAIAVWCTYFMQSAFRRPRQAIFLRVQAVIVVVLLAVGFVYSQKITSIAEDSLYSDHIVLAKTSAYQRIVVTEGKSGFQLFINGALQFSSADEHRYHEALVHPAMSVARDLGGSLPRRVLVLGGGDGLAVRELLRYPSIEKVVLVDLDPTMTDLGRELPQLASQNRKSLHDPRVEIVNKDAFVWLRAQAKKPPYDVMVVDFPDPNSYSLGKLYTTSFYRLAQRVLAKDGALVIQSTSPMLARRSFWTVVETVESVGFKVRPFHAAVPSFGEWGYVLAAHRDFEIPERLSVSGLNFLTDPSLPTLFVFTADTSRVPAEPNSLNNQVLVQVYGEEWSRWN